MNAPPRLRIARALLDELRAAAARAYPEEMCALLVGRDRAEGDDAIAEVTRLVPCANLHPDPRRGFEVDPRVLFALHRELRKTAAASAKEEPAERLLGHAHSHPDAPARPSDTDRALAHESGLAWLILPVRKGRVGAARAWLASEDVGAGAGFRPMRLAFAAEPETA